MRREIIYGGPNAAQMDPLDKETLAVERKLSDTETLHNAHPLRRSDLPRGSSFITINRGQALITTEGNAVVLHGIAKPGTDFERLAKRVGKDVGHRK